MSIDKVSVIIRTKNEERWVGHTIQSIIDVIKKPEIIIIDNKSTDKTLDIVKYFEQAPGLEFSNNSHYTKIKIKTIKDYSPGKALNLGVKNSTNKYILIISAHCVLTKIDLKKNINNLKKYSCIFGNQIPVYYGKKITKRYLWSHFVNNKVENMYSKLENRYFLHNALAFYNKNVLKKYPFDENLVAKEDRYWVNKIIKKNEKTLYDPTLEATHHYTKDGNTWKGVA
jgi:rhamnosyltransferase